MSNIEEKEQDTVVDEEILREADGIAAQITSMLVEAFKAKEGRDPTPEEVEQLIEEVTQERIEELLGATASATEAEEEEGQDQEGSDEEDGEDEDGDSDNDEDEDEDEDAEEPENSDANISNPFLSLPQGQLKVTVSGDAVKGADDDENEAKRRRIASD